MDPVLAASHLSCPNTETHHGDERLQQDRRLGADDVRTEDASGTWLTEQFDAVPLVLQGPAIGDVGILLDEGHVVHTVLTQLTLGGTHRSHLRIAEHGVRDESFVGTHEILGVKQVVCHDPGLGIGDVFESPVGADITQGPDVRHTGALVLVGDDETIVVHLHTCGRHIEPIRVGDAPGGVEDEVGRVVVRHAVLVNGLDDEMITRIDVDGRDLLTHP